MTPLSFLKDQPDRPRGERAAAPTESTAFIPAEAPSVGPEDSSEEER